ncbi:hypothetical protein C1703_20925 [Streptomyces sp. Go-475]|nr:hypothetical protein C1703_20925 [Streptomyces sp. Go-475]
MSTATPPRPRPVPPLRLVAGEALAVVRQFPGQGIPDAGPGDGLGLRFTAHRDLSLLTWSVAPRGLGVRHRLHGDDPVAVLHGRVHPTGVGGQREADHAEDPGRRRLHRTTASTVAIEMARRDRRRAAERQTTGTRRAVSLADGARASHVAPDAPRALMEWDGQTWVTVGVAPNADAAREFLGHVPAPAPESGPRPSEAPPYVWRTPPMPCSPTATAVPLSDHLVAAFAPLTPDPGRAGPGRAPKATYERAAPEDPVLSDADWAAVARRMVAATGITPDGDEQACRCADDGLRRVTPGDGTAAERHDQRRTPQGGTPGPSTGRRPGGCGPGRRPDGGRCARRGHGGDDQVERHRIVCLRGLWRACKRRAARAHRMAPGLDTGRGQGRGRRRASPERLCRREGDPQLNVPPRPGERGARSCTRCAHRTLRSVPMACP